MNPVTLSSAPSRREFLSFVAAAGAATALGAQTGRQSDPGASGGAATIHVFSKPLQWLSYDDTAALVAETGGEGIDYTVRRGGHVLPERVEEDLPRAVDAARKHGLKVEMITTGLVGAGDAHAEAIVRTAAKLGVKYYRTGYVGYDLAKGIQPSLEKHKAAFKELADLNRQYGIHGAYQNHSGTRVGGPVWDLYEIVRDLDPRWFGVQYDIRHATVEGAQAWPLGLRLLAPWIRCADIKDFKWDQAPGKATIENVPLGEGVVSFDRYFSLVRELNIRGPYSLHLEYPPFERAKISEAEKRARFPASMRHDIAALKGWLAKHHIG